MPVHSYQVGHELGSGGPSFLRKCCADEGVVRRFSLHQTLKSHFGCVNTVNWNSSGSLLISGSDDTRLCIYDYHDNSKLLHKIDTGHSANIFSAKFMPFQDDRVVCCAGDDEVRTFHNYEPDQVYTCHQGRVKKISTHVDQPHTFLSASEDGTVRHFDTRIRGPDQGDHILVAVGSQYGDYNLEVYSLAYDPMNSNYFIVGGGDPFVRLYDMRVLGVGGKSTTQSDRRKEDRCVKAFRPQTLKGSGDSAFSMTGHITGVAYSWDGREVLASYSGDGIYLFDVKESQDERTRSMRDPHTESEDESSSSSNSNNNNNNNDEDTTKSKKKKAKGKHKRERDEEVDGDGEDLHRTYTQRYVGHCNIRTVKEVNFYGPSSEYVVSGSDCGRIFIWDKKTAKLVNMMKGDRDVVNCAAGHPFDPVLATSGIESNVKLWTPKSETLKVITKQDEDTMTQNNNSTSNRHNMPDLFALIRAFTRREIMLRQRRRAAAAEAGEEIEGDDEDDQFLERALESDDDDDAGEAEDGEGEGEGEGEGDEGQEGEGDDGDELAEGERSVRCRAQ